MINYRRVQSLIYQIQKLFEPEFLGWRIHSVDFFTSVKDDWKKAYSVENREKLAKEILKDLEYYTQDKSPQIEDFGDTYPRNLEIFKTEFLKVLEEYPYKKFDRNRFFSWNRKLRITENMEDNYLGSIFRDLNFSIRRKVTKEELVLMLETYCYCFEYIAKNINKREVQVELLEKLGLPVEVENLASLVLNCKSLGELFDWKATEYDFIYWAKDFLDNPEQFKIKVYNYLNSLHPDLRLKVEKPKPNPIKINTQDAAPLKAAYRNFEIALDAAQQIVAEPLF